MRTAEDVTHAVCALFRNGLRISDIDVDKPLLDYGLDSIRSAEIIIELERVFAVEISDDDAATLLTAHDVIEFVRTELDRRSEVGA
ncbi:acyl carrier protein [Nocardia higoensis]|uniref:acyl carrier protein n=1 Tax=Nocardia higoensis TaxID=228599 RepID=UPI0012F69703|nr:acyl carrier protein [Nocardia higoensis]